MPFQEFLFYLFLEEKGREGAMPGRGAELPHLGAPPGAGRWEGGARSLPPPCGWAGGGRSVARIASVFLFALFLFVTVALS